MKDNNHNPLAPFNPAAAMELRKGVRLPAHLPSVLIEKDHSIYTTIINLSADGIGLLAGRPLCVGEDIEVKFEYKGSDEIIPVTIKVHIIYCYEIEDEYYIGGSISEKPLEFTQFYCSSADCRTD